MQPAAALVVDVVSGNWQPINIFIEKAFANENKLLDSRPSDIIANDLTVSGRFKVHRYLADNSRIPNDKRLDSVRNKGGEYLITGAILSPATGDGNQSIQFALWDALTDDLVGQYSIPFDKNNQRLAAHNIANWVYEKITGKTGVFHTKVAYVLRQQNGKNLLRIADYDGYNQQTLLSSDNIIISPTWTPDGNSLLYVSFEQNKPIIYKQSLLNGERRIVANFKGSNSAPAMSPDQRYIAATLTEHGGAQQIYLLQNNGKTRLRHSDGIDTEPDFSPDAKRLVFTSDEPGSPQIYEYYFDSGNAKRLTFGSRYNASPSYAGSGNSITFIRRNGRGNNVAVMDLPSRKVVLLTDIRLADSPSFSPNDDFILFLDESRKNRLATVSINGKVTVYWEGPEKGSIVDPVWSPFQSDWF